MSTPADAPYKLAQRTADERLRASRRLGRVDRRRLVGLAAAAGRSSRQLDREGVLSRALLRRLVPALTRAERAEAGLLGWES